MDLEEAKKVAALINQLHPELQPGQPLPPRIYFNTETWQWEPITDADLAKAQAQRMIKGV